MKAEINKSSVKTPLLTRDEFKPGKLYLSDDRGNNSNVYFKVEDQFLFASPDLTYGIASFTRSSFSVAEFYEAPEGTSFTIKQ